MKLESFLVLLFTVGTLPITASNKFAFSIQLLNVVTASVLFFLKNEKLLILPYASSAFMTLLYLFFALNDLVLVMLLLCFFFVLGSWISSTLVEEITERKIKARILAEFSGAIFLSFSVTYLTLSLQLNVPSTFQDAILSTTLALIILVLYFSLQQK